MKSVQHAIRNRFKSDHKHDKHHHDQDEHEQNYKSLESERSYQDDHNFHVVGQQDLDEASITSADSSSIHTEIIDNSHGNNGHGESSPIQFDERAVYEQQLTQLQEQLVAVMIENQSLNAQVQEYVKNSEVDDLKEQLEAEKEKCEHLQSELVNERKKRLPSSSRDTTPEVDIAKPAADFELVDGPPPDPPGKRSLMGRLWACVFGWVYELIEDLEPLEPQGEESEEGSPLTVKQLKENIKRFKTALVPYIQTFKGLHRLMTWKSPAFTLLVFGLYMYTVYQGLFFPFTLFLLTFRLGISFLRHKGYNITFNYLDPGEEEKKKDNEELGMSAKFDLVLFVARKVQNILGSLADSLEKIKNLLIWEQPEATRTVFFGLFGGFVVSCIFEASVLFYFGGLYMGVKLFVIDFFFNRYPRLKRKRDTAYKIWLSLPTDSEVEHRLVSSELDKYILPQQSSSEASTWSDSQIDHMTRDDKSFCQLFSLPLSEGPLPDWHGGKRCTLINKDKSLTGAFKNGRLFLTRSFLCFERSKSPTPKNIVIPLTDIAHIEKAKPYAWMPGGGMAIEIVLSGSEKHLLFGAFINRDETFMNIMSAGAKAEQPWAIAFGHRVAPERPPASPALRRFHSETPSGGKRLPSPGHPQHDTDGRHFSSLTLAGQ